MSFCTCAHQGILKYVIYNCVCHNKVHRKTHLTLRSSWNRLVFSLLVRIASCGTAGLVENVSWASPWQALALAHSHSSCAYFPCVDSRQQQLRWFFLHAVGKGSCHNLLNVTKTLCIPCISKETTFANCAGKVCPGAVQSELWDAFGLGFLIARPVEGKMMIQGFSNSKLKGCKLTSTRLQDTSSQLSSCRLYYALKLHSC